MLAIRLQRTGRKGHAQFRVVVQEASRSPASGRVVARLGYYDPHTKTTDLNKEKTMSYLDNGAQPSPRVASLLMSEKVKMPAWVVTPDQKKRNIKNPDKLRKNRPPEPKVSSDGADGAVQESASSEKEPEEKVAAESKKPEEPADDSVENGQSKDPGSAKK